MDGAMEGRFPRHPSIVMWELLKIQFLTAKERERARNINRWKCVICWKRIFFINLAEFREFRGWFGF
jgi:hypothetical protein